MSCRLARFLLIFAALCLPLQAMAGLVMQVGGMDDAAQVAPQAAAPEHCPYHDAGAVPASDDPSSDHGCNICGVCHLACSGYLPASVTSTAVLPATESYLAVLAPLPPSNIPEPPQHPPKRS